MSLRDRFFTPRVFRALWSPISLGLLVVVSVVGVVVGLPVAVAIGIGVVAYAARIGASMAGGGEPRARRIDPFVLSEPWRRHVQSALSAKGRFDRTVRSTRSGPIKERLEELATKLDAAVNESWRIAVRGDEIDAALSQLNPQRAQAELQRLRDSTDAHQAAAVASLEATIASGRRMQAVSTSTRSQLQLLDTRLEELVARAAEVSVGAGDGGVLGNDVDDLVTSLEGLRLALEDTNRSAPQINLGTPSTSAMPATVETRPSPMPSPAPPEQPEQPVEKPQTWPPR